MTTMLPRASLKTFSLLRAVRQATINQHAKFNSDVSLKESISELNRRLNHPRTAKHDLTLEPNDPREKPKIENREKLTKLVDKKDRDAFGTIAQSDDHLRVEAEYLPDDEDNYDVMKTTGNKRHPIWYRWEFQRLLRTKGKHGVKEMLELYRQMRIDDGFVPDRAHFSPLIQACALVGYTQKAMELFDEMLRLRERGERYEFNSHCYPTKATVTALFNVCAECPDKKYGLQSLEKVRTWQKDTVFELNQIHYHTLIKAYGKLGDLPSAFKTVDEMIYKKIKPNSRTFGALLMGCISDNRSGLTHAIRIMRRMRVLGIERDEYIYNLFLRVIRDCEIGSVEYLQKLIKEWGRIDRKAAKQLAKASQKYKIKEKWVPIADENFLTPTESISSGCLDEVMDPSDRNKSVSFEILANYKEMVQAKKGQELSLTSQLMEMPNLLLMTSESLKGHLVSIDFNSLSLPHNRLMLVGGMNGMLAIMQKDEVKPTIKTMSLLLDLTPCNDSSEKEIMQKIDEFNISPDVDFFNMLVKRVCSRKDALAAKPLLTLMHRHGLAPDIMTFGVLATGCKSHELRVEFLRDLNTIGLRPNVEICTALIQRAAADQDFRFLMRMITLMETDGIRPHRLTIEIIETLINYVHKCLTKYDHSSDKEAVEIPTHFLDKKFRTRFHIFRKQYQSWLKRVEVEEEQPPWKQYEVKIEDPHEDMHHFETVMRRKLEQRFGEPLGVPSHFHDIKYMNRRKEDKKYTESET